MSIRTSLSRLVEACEFAASASTADIELCGVSTDTRTLEPGELFVALVGDTFDGHQFVAAAIEKGAPAVVVSNPNAAPPDTSAVVITVESTVAALGCIGRFWRTECDPTVIAVTGSAGKTTTKDMIGFILGAAGPVRFTEATENNEIGVAKTLLSIEPSDAYCVVEFGMRARGEIDFLARISRPDIAVITNIGEAHIGLLGSREAVAEAKAEVLPHLPSDGSAILNADDYFFPLLSNMTGARIVSFGTGEATVRLESARLLGTTGAAARLVMPTGAVEIELQVPGRHNLMNAAAAAAAAYSCGLAPATIAERLGEFNTRAMRSQVIAASGGFSVIHDAYNASPTSTPPALEVLAQAPGRKVFVFGDMLELGPAAEEAHRTIGRLAEEAGVGVLVAVGELASFAAEQVAQTGIETYRASTAEEAAPIAAGIVAPGDTVLVKGSRGMHLEVVVEELLRV